MANIIAKHGVFDLIWSFVVLQLILIELVESFWYFLCETDLQTSNSNRNLFLIDQSINYLFLIIKKWFDLISFWWRQHKVHDRNFVIVQEKRKTSIADVFFFF